MSDFQVRYESTPNPQSLKFLVTASITDGEAVNFATAGEASRSPLAKKIFGFPWAAGVYIGPNFVTITKQEWVDWDVLADPLADLINEHLKTGQPVLLEADLDEGHGTDDAPDDSPVVSQIKRILREEIRPAVAMDGGDIVFRKYENGRVHLLMQGACSGCPSSAMTLKDGIETRLKESIPEILEVVAD